MEFPQQILNECRWIKNCQINSNTTVVHCIPHPNSIQQLHLCPCNATQGQVSVRCEATTIHSSSRNISHLRLLSDGYLRRPNFVSTAIIQQLTPKSSIIPRPLMQFQEKTLTLRANQILNLKTIQGTVRRDLVKVNDPSLKKAPPDVEFGSDGASCHAST